MIDIDQIDWQKHALIPAIVQDEADGSVLMLAYMNKAALQTTLDKGLVSFFSRSRQSLWTKGETSGHFLQLKHIALDCDADTLLVTARPIGPSCHTGSETCWGSRRPTPLFFEELEATIDQRMAAADASSYTRQLIESGPKRLAQKVGEEGVEVALASLGDDSEELLGEAADLLFHLMVLLRTKNLRLSDVSDILRARHQKGQKSPS